MKKFKAKIRKKLVINDIANYYFNLFENQNNNIEF